MWYVILDNAIFYHLVILSDMKKGKQALHYENDSYTKKEKDLLH